MAESPRRLRLDTVAAFLADCRARQLSHRTLEHYQGSIDSFRRFLGGDSADHVVADLAIDRARAWAASLTVTRTPASVGDAIACVDDPDLAEEIEDGELPGGGLLGRAGAQAGDEVLEIRPGDRRPGPGRLACRTLGPHPCRLGRQPGAHPTM